MMRCAFLTGAGEPPPACVRPRRMSCSGGWRAGLRFSHGCAGGWTAVGLHWNGLGAALLEGRARSELDAARSHEEHEGRTKGLEWCAAQVVAGEVLGCCGG